MNADTAQSLAIARIRDSASLMQSLLQSSEYLSTVANVAVDGLHSSNCAFRRFDHRAQFVSVERIGVG